MGLRTFDQAKAYAESVVANPGHSWSNLCQKFSHECVGSAPFGAYDPVFGCPTARTAFQWAKDNNVAYTTGPPPAGSLAYFDTGRTGHAVFVADGGDVYSTPFGSLTGTSYGVRRTPFKAFPKYMGYITHVPEGALDIRTAGSTTGSQTPARNSPSDSSSGQLPSSQPDPPAYAPGPGQSTANSSVNSTVVDVSTPWVLDTRPIKYNPPLVRSAMHNEGFGPASDTFSFVYGEVNGTAGGGLGLPFKTTQMGRLGRIVPEDTAPPETANKGSNRYGFRFLYNPASYAENIAVNQNVDPQVAALNLSNSLSANASFSVSLYLNRIEDLRYTSYPGFAAYPMAVAKDDWEGIQQFGTLWDVEYLMRTVNGAPIDTWRGSTAEFGQMYGIPSRFYLGRGRRLRGRLMSVSLNHLMFSKDMVPILTEVQLGVMRYPDTLLDVGATASFIDPRLDPVNNAHSINDPEYKAAQVVQTLANGSASPWPPTNVSTTGTTP